MARLLCVGAFLVSLSLAGHARQSRSIADHVYSDAQAARGQQLYAMQCVTCHGGALEGVAGPPLAGDGFLSVWSSRSLADLVNKIEQTMPPGRPDSMSRPQAIDLAAFILRSGKYEPGPSELGSAELGQIAFPTRAPGVTSAASSSFSVAGNLAQLMRAVTFPNANILFNVQVKDPATYKPAMPIPFDYVIWGSTVYYGWQAVDQAALAIIETTPLFLLPGRRCENGRPVPVDRPEWKQFTSALVDAGRLAYRASQARNVDAMNTIAEQLNETCANCHKAYRDGAREGNSAGGSRCQ